MYPYYNNYQQPIIQPTSQLYNVNGVEGAKAFYVMPNSINYFLDSDSPYLYKKVADQTGRATIQKFKLVEDNLESPQTAVSSVDYTSIDKKLDELLSLLKTPKNEVTTNE